jgi:hypothetical protein
MEAVIRYCDRFRPIMWSCLDVVKRRTGRDAGLARLGSLTWTAENALPGMKEREGGVPPATNHPQRIPPDGIAFPVRSIYTRENSSRKFEFAAPIRSSPPLPETVRNAGGWSFSTEGNGHDLRILPRSQIQIPNPPGGVALFVRALIALPRTSRHGQSRISP